MYNHWPSWLIMVCTMNSGYEAHWNSTPDTVEWALPIYINFGGGGGGEDQEKSGWAIQYTILYYTMLNNVGVKTVKSFNFISKY